MSMQQGATQPRFNAYAVYALDIVHAIIRILRSRLRYSGCSKATSTIRPQQLGLSE